MERSEGQHSFDSDPITLPQGWKLIGYQEGPNGTVLRVGRSGDQQRGQWIIATGPTLEEAIQTARRRIELFEDA